MKAKPNTATSSSLPKSWAIVLFIAIASIPFWGTGCDDLNGTDDAAKGHVTSNITRIEYAAAATPLKLIHPPEAKVGDQVAILNEKGEAVNFINGGFGKVNLVADEPLKSGDDVKAVFYENTQTYAPTSRTSRTTVRIGIIKIRPEQEEILAGLKEKAANPAKPKLAETENKK